MTEARGGGHGGRVASAGSSSNADRRHALVRIAYRHLAERGFEGLRVRAVAAEAGINHATLLHYFPTKEALIQGVVMFLVQEFSINRSPDDGTATPGPLEEVRREFADVRHRLRATPEMFVVLSELAVRARRDTAIAHILHEMEEGWRGQLVHILARGVADGVFRPDLVIEDTAMALTTQLAAIGYRVLDPVGAADLDRQVAQVALQVEHWLTVAGDPPVEGGRAREEMR